MARGGARQGAGPKKESDLTPQEKSQRLTRKKIREKAAESGQLPHEWLLDVARGECIKQKKLEITYYKTGPDKNKEKSRRWVEEDYYPTFNERMSAAQSAAPYYAPRLATQVIKTDEKTASALTGVMKAISEKLPV